MDTQPTFPPKINESVTFKNEAEELLGIRRTVSGSKGFKLQSKHANERSNLYTRNALKVESNLPSWRVLVLHVVSSTLPNESQRLTSMLNMVPSGQGMGADHAPLLHTLYFVQPS